MTKGPFRVRDLATLDEHLSDATAKEQFHYRVTLADDNRFLLLERYKEGLLLQDRAEFSYSTDGETELTIKRCYDETGSYTGKVIGKFTPPDLHEAEVYDQDDVLVSKTQGLFNYQIMDRKLVSE